MMKREEWRTTLVTPNYEVSNLGRVRHSISKHVMHPWTSTKSKSNTDHIQRALRVSLRDVTTFPTGKHVHNYSVSVLVAQAFGVVSPGVTAVYHVDGDYQNNQVDNLTGIQQEQVKATTARRKALASILSENPEWVLIQGDVTDGRNRAIFEHTCHYQQESPMQSVTGRLILYCPVCHMQDKYLSSTTFTLKGDTYKGFYSPVDVLDSRCGKVFTHPSMQNMCYGPRCPYCDAKADSQQEAQIMNILNDLGATYVQQYMDSRITFIGILRFDFALVDSEGQVQGCIEYQGPQHYDNVRNRSQEEWDTYIKRDQIKLQCCKELGIPLLIIPYTWSHEQIVGAIVGFTTGVGNK